MMIDDLLKQLEANEHDRILHDSLLRDWTYLAIARSFYGLVGPDARLPVDLPTP